MKFNDEELSRILSAHAKRGLGREGMSLNASDKPCLIEVAERQEAAFSTGSVSKEGTATWFDRTYRPNWSVDRFLAQLEARGLA